MRVLTPAALEACAGGAGEVIRFVLPVGACVVGISSGSQGAAGWLPAKASDSEIQALVGGLVRAAVTQASPGSSLSARVAGSAELVARVRSALADRNISVAGSAERAEALEA